VDLYPESLSVNSPEHGLPIHIASSEADPPVVEYLVSKYPASLDVYNEPLGLPLHYLLVHRYADRKNEITLLFMHSFAIAK
jgi:hypothetical protein